MNNLSLRAIDAISPANDLGSGFPNNYLVGDHISKPTKPSRSASAHAAEVTLLMIERMNRTRFFSRDLFSDPAWDILLELYAAELGQYRIAISSLCLRTAVPSTTVLRWVSVLDSEGLITRRKDPFDQRRVYVGLTTKGSDCMESYVEANARALPSLWHPSAGLAPVPANHPFIEG